MNVFNSFTPQRFRFAILLCDAVKVQLRHHRNLKCRSAPEVTMADVSGPTANLTFYWKRTFYIHLFRFLVALTNDIFIFRLLLVPSTSTGTSKIVWFG